MRKSYKSSRGWLTVCCCSSSCHCCSPAVGWRRRRYFAPCRPDRRRPSTPPICHCQQSAPPTLSSWRPLDSFSCGRFSCLAICCLSSISFVWNNIPPLISKTTKLHSIRFDYAEITNDVTYIRDSARYFNSHFSKK